MEIHFDHMSDYGFEKNKVLLDQTQVAAVISQSSSCFRSLSTKRVTALSRRKRVPPLSLISPQRVPEVPWTPYLRFQVPRSFRVENPTVTFFFLSKNENKCYLVDSY